MTTLTNLKIWDGLNFVEADTLQFSEGVISYGGTRDDLPEHAEPIDCSGLTAIPGLIDAHVHMELNPDDKHAPARTEPSVIPLMKVRAQQMVRAGITTARDLGGGAWYELQLRDEIASGQASGPRLLCAGQPITTPSGHCHFWGGGADSLGEAQQVLERQLEHGVDLIKVMATGGRLTPGSTATDAQFEQRDLRAMVRMAHDAGMPVAAHCHGTEGIRRAANAGVDTIEHCSWVGNEGWGSDYQEPVARLILQNGIWVSPTVNKGWQRMLDSKTGKVLRRMRAAYRHMIDMGIPLVASTDAGIPGVYHHELPQALLVFAQIAQLSSEQVLRSATSDAAIALGIEELTGRLAPGLSADVLVIDGNPITDLSAITRPVMVYCRGAQARA